MDEGIQQALDSDRLIDITTTGRRSGNPHRIEIAFHLIDGKVYTSGMPGTRDWYANLPANPDLIFHLKQSVEADIPARATPITDKLTRREVLNFSVARWRREREIENFVENSPLIEVQLETAPEEAGI